MATIEKLMKSWEALKHLPTQLTDEIASRRKEKISLCVTTADTFCSSPGLKSGGVNVMLLSFAMESLLQMCNDSDSDVRMTADESLNRIIRQALMDSNVMKVQVELHKEIKRNGNARSLRAALWRFAYLSHMIRPQKGKPYVNNLVPCLIQISKRSEEPVQETLANAMPQIFKALGLFTTDKDVKELLKAFLLNLSSDSAQVRRTAASCIVSICQNCRKPKAFIMETLNTLVDSVIPIKENQAVPEILGVLGCLRAVLPQISMVDAEHSGQEELQGSFGVKRGHNRSTHSTDCMVQVYELSIHFSRHADHNVVNAALELLHQLLLSPPSGLIPILLSPHGISRSKILPSSSELSPFQRRSLSQMSVAGSIPPCDENSLLELDSDLPTAMSAAVSAPLLERWIQDGSSAPVESLPLQHTAPSKSNVARLQLLDAADPSEPDLTFVPEHDNFGSPAADVISTDSSPDDVRENYLLESLDQETELAHQNTPPPSASGVSLASSPGANQAEAKYQVCDIGSLTDGSIPLVYCARHLATSFLLTGYPGYRMPDRNVRVSVKALALNCVAAIVRLHPNVFQLYLDKDPISPSRRSSASSSSSQPLCELLLFAKHTDPQLRAICCTLLAGLVRSVLVQSGGNWQSWQRKADAKVSACLALPRLMQFLIQGLEDESSTTCRQTLVALAQCLPELLRSRDCHEVQLILNTLSNLAKNPYWLVKVKLLELVCELPYVVIHFVVGSSTFQDKVLHGILFDLLSDEDSRVRKAASESIVRIIPNLYHLIDRQNVSEVIAVASDDSESQLSHLLVDSEPTSATIGRTYQKIPRLDNLFTPFDSWNNIEMKSQHHCSVEASLSRVVDSLSHLLLESSSKHLTLGCCETLSVLAENYPPALYINGWSCLYYPNPSTTSNTKRDTKHVVGDGISLVNFSPASGLLHTILGLLMTSPTTLELGAQQWLNSLSGNLFCGVAVANMHPIESPPPGLKLEPNPYPNQLWSMFKDRQICIAAESLLLHVMRTLNIISHILEDSHPTTSGSKPGLPSLSPIKRHGSSAGRTTTNESPNENKAGRGMSPIKNIIHGEKEDKSDEKKSGKSTLFGSFANNQHYLKYYDLLRSSYSNYKMSLELEICDKFVGLLSSTLKVLSQLLEVMTLVEAGRIAEELLFYLRGTMSLSPTATVSCVSQLLKCVVGMNLVSFWGERSSENESKHCYPVSTISRKENGFYFNCFQKPYQQLVQFLTAASAAKPLSVEVAGVIGNYRLRADAKTGCRMADTTYLASYIRLFEPMVIESLQQYTVTSDIQLQVKVLALLTQLVQLRVNYCLLDSDMVFISFIQKQFEFIEEGQISNAEDLIMCIFHFMVLLSFEKHHSKSITTIPKVIQLCDGLMASGQNPLTHCIPALLPVVEHGFLYKSAGSLSTIDTEELETQREFMVAMLLRLVEYHQVMKLLSVVLVECRSWPDGEERWRRWSRQVCDAVLGHLTSGRLRLDSCDAQKSLHQLLLHSLAPSVFRPVDPLLRVLFSPPPHVDSSLQSVIRWLGTVIAVMLVLVAQGKEETTLTRLEEMEIALPALFFRGDTVHLASPDPLNAAAIATSPLSTSTPQLTFARLVLRVIGLVSERIDSIVMDPASSSELLKECHYLEELLAHFLMICIHMFQSGSHCKIASAAVELVAGHATEDSLLLEDANAVFLELAPACPLLMFLWCYLLTLLNYGNHAFWARVLPLPKENSKKDELTQRHQSLSINVELVRTGATIVYCDFMCENSGESEQLQWLLSTQMLHIIELSSEAPVQELIAVLHRNPDHSSFMLQAIQKNNFPLNKATTVVRLLKCLEGVHPACSGALLLLLADHFIGHAHPALARRAAQLCTRQAEYLLTLSPPQVAEQLSREQLRDVLHSLHHSHLDRKHSGLISILNKLGSQCLALSPLETDQVRPLTPTSIQSMKLDKEWYLSQVKLRCSQTSSTGVAVEESTQLLGHLDVEDAVSVLSSPDTHLSILQLCFRHGTHQTLQAHTTATQGKNVEDTLSPLYRAARMVLMQRVHHFTELVPKDHQVFLPVGRSMTDAESIYSRNLCQVIINDVQLNALFCLAASVNSYIHSLEKLCGVVPSEAAEDLVAFALLCLEAVHSLLTQDDGKGTNNAEKLKSEKRSKSLSIEAHDVPSSGKVTADKKLNTPQPYCFELGLECASRVLCEPSLGVFLDQPNRLTWLASACSAVTAVVHFVSLGEPLPAVPMNGLSEALSKPESLTIAHACHQMSTLIAWLEKSCFNKICRNVPSFLTSPIQKLIVRLARTPLLNSYVWTPPDVWKHGWDVTPGGPYQIQVPPLPTEFLQDMDVLRQFIFRVTLLGWISRQQFEETWMSLLSVLSSESNSEDIPSEEMAIETEANSVVIEAITTLLLQTLLLPIPGNPNIGHYLHCTRDFPIKFSSGSTLQKLHSIQQRLVWKEESLHGKKVYSVFDRPNLEHIHSLKRYSYGQVSVEYLQYALACSQGAAEKDLFSESVVSKYEERCKALESSGMDVNSCLFFLLDLCTQWTQPQLAGMSIVQSRPLHEALCAVLSVSDLFTEQSQWQWLLQTSLDLGRSQPAEDEILHQYIVLSQCKACAVLQPDATVYERILRSLDIALRSSFVPTVTAALHGLSYLLQGGLLIQCGRETIKSDTSTLPESLQDPSSTLPEVIRNVVTLTAEYICKKLVSNSISSVNEEPNLILWSLAFYLLDNWSRWKVDALEQAAPVILQQAISLAHPFSRSSPTLQRIISQGLERLVVSQSEALTSRLQEQVTKLAVENLVDPNPGVLFHSLQLLLSCMYRGRDSQIMVHSNDSAESDSAVNITDPEQLVQAMEKTSALFDRIKKGYPQEVELVCSVLPNLLTDFFPASEVLTKVVGEFLSQQQPHPRLLAGVVFQVFECAVAQSHLSLLQEWLVLSFSNFTQTLPVPMATWCLTCFFISASSNPWLRALFPHVQSRIGRCEFEDRKLLCLSAADFYRQLTSESQTRKFLSTFQAAVQKQPNSPYAELLASLN